MKYIDKFLKKLNTNRNTFATFILTLLTIYLCVDRLVEMLIMIFTGVSVSYWNPIQYTLALACPTFAFLFSGNSSFASSKSKKVTLFYAYVIGLYIIALSMFTQWINAAGWILFISVPNYSAIVNDFKDLVQPAFTSLALYLPLVTILPLIKWIVLGVNDTTEMIRSLWDYKGIDLSDTKKGHGQYTCDVKLFTNRESGKTVLFAEEKRYQALLVCGGSGSGKTSLIFEPFIAKDIEKKFFFSEISKELGFTALKTGLATLNCPYDNDYINDTFSLNMLTPVAGKEGLYNAYMKKMILSSSPYIYRNLGITYLAPDPETISHIKEICENFGFRYNIIDPSDSNSIGMNPFVYDDISKISLTISSVLKEVYTNNFNAKGEEMEAYREEVVLQAIENLSILLKEVYPTMNQGALPNLEDMLKLLSNFDLVEKMCKILETDEELSEKYAIMLGYFKRNFYKNGKGRDDTEKYLSFLTTQLDNLLRLPGVKSTLCNRYNNINFDKMLEEGQITLVCTRRGDLGASSHKAFGLFYLLSMQNAVLRRYGNEQTRIPHFLYIDEFPEFICRSTDTMFTMYRKYRVATIVSIQNLTQLETHLSKVDLKQTILSNCANKIFTGNATPEECKWWSSEFGQRRKWKYTSSMDNSKLEYDSKITAVKWDWEDYFQPGKLQTLPLKSCAFSIRNDNNRPTVGEGVLNYVSSKFYEKQNIKKYNFTKYTAGISDNSSVHHHVIKSNKFFNDDYSDEIDPIQTEDDLNLFDNEDAIIFNLNDKKQNNN